MKKYLLSLTFIFAAFALYAQSSNLLSDGAADFLRRSQLEGKVSTRNSLMINSFSSNLLGMDSLLHTPPQEFKVAKWKVELLPLTRTAQFNSDIAHGSNDGAMIPSKGMQWVLSGGAKLSWNHWELQLKPEYIYAQNLPFETFPTEHYPVFWQQYYRWLNHIDNPESFGSSLYRKVVPGQSSFKYKFKQWELGVSTENIWWGPGRLNALMLSNNAPGFMHFTANTTAPIKTPWGNVEGQVIAGRLESSGILPPDHYRYMNGEALYVPKPGNNRNIEGMILSWQPKWTPHVSVGMTMVNYGYEGKSNASSMGSLFARYVMPKDKAELYFEFGRNDKIPTLMNMATDNGFPRGYVAGFRKLVPIKNAVDEKYIELAGELTQLQLPTSTATFGAQSWYTSANVQHGYTNQGKVLGAGIGPGSNSQTVSISYVHGFTKLGVQFERLLHNNDFYYNAFIITNDATRHWVDVSTTFIGNYRYKRFLLSSKMGFIRSLNYEWYILEGQGYFKNGYDVLNFHTNLSLSYRF